MGKKTVTITRGEAQAIVDVVENGGILDAPVITKVNRALEDAEEDGDVVVLSLWPREVEDIEKLTQKGKFWHPDGDTLLQSGLKKMREAFQCGSTPDDSQGAPAS